MQSRQAETVSFSKDTMSNEIAHVGVIDSISEGAVHVRIVQNSACSSCKVASYCNSAESKEKIIDVVSPDAQQYVSGQPVTVSTTTGNAHKAVFLAFGIPFILMVAVIVIVYLLSADEGVAALCGIASLLPYYFTLYALRERIGSRFAFRIETISN